MPKIRAYKLAEELGIERSQFVEKAAAVGVVLKTHMSSIDEQGVELLRRKLGTPDKSKKFVTVSRVEAKGGAVIRRRKRVAVEPSPEAPEVPVEPAPEISGEIASTPAAIEPASIAAAEPVPAESAPVPEPLAPAAAATAAAPAAPTTAREKEKTQGKPEQKSGRQRKLVREVVNLQEQERLARQATGRLYARRPVSVDPGSVASPRRRRRDALPAKKATTVAPKEVKRVVRIQGSVAVGDLARMLGAKAPEVQKKLMALGTMVSINTAIDLETATHVSAEFGYEVEDVGFREEQFLDAGAGDTASEPRPPVVTVMGHVDHGKTTLLDALRKTNIVGGEAGGITQHIGAYQVEINAKTITFIDTPGHAAFTDMRARGAQATDIVILVIAATEGIMPQTVEAIEHSKSAGVPIVVAINKCDLPGANSQQARQRLMEHGLVPEDFGGETICVDISATQGTGLAKLLEMVSLQAELLELTADPKRRATGFVLESRLDKGRGAVATVLVQQGTMKRGDPFVVGTYSGRIRALEDENQKRIQSAGPSMPVQVVGLSGVPEAGSIFSCVESERVGKSIVEHRLDEKRRQSGESRPVFTLDEFFEKMEGGGVYELRIVLKGDVHGSIEAIREALVRLSTDAVKVDVVLSGVGAITKDDIMLAKASGAMVLGFHVRPDPSGRAVAEQQGIEIRAYKIIYELLDDVKQAMVGLLPPTVTEVMGGRAEVRETFTVPKVGTIAGCFVADGSVRRGAACRLVRDGVQVYEGKVGSLKRFKDDAREVNSGFECGIGIEGYNDVKIADVIETYVLEEKPATLE